MSTCLTDLAATLNALLPACPTGQVCRQVVDARGANGRGCVQLEHAPTSAPTILSACGGVISRDSYLMDYTSGTLYTCAAAGQILISYTYNLAATYIQQAVRDLGLRLPQRNTICTPLFANCGLAPLPCSVHHIDWIRVSSCTCGQPTCHQCLTMPRCQCNNNLHFSCGSCGLYQRGDHLVVNPPPCTDHMLHLCYLGGYPLDQAGCYSGLTAELADLVLLKAQALAYSNPRLLFTLAGITTSNNDSSTDTTANTGSEDNTYTETITVTKTYGTCGKETGSTTTKTGTKESDTTSNRTTATTNASNLLRSTQWLSLARQFQTDYETGILLHSESANIGRRHHDTRGYRARIATGGSTELAEVHW